VFFENNPAVRYWLYGALFVTGLIRLVIVLSRRPAVEPEQLESDLRDAEKAVRLNPQDTDAWFDLGDARAALKDFFGAREAFAQATVLNPKDAEALYHQARTCVAIDEEGEATDLVAKAITLKPELRHSAASDPAFNSIRNDSPLRELLG